MRGSNSRSWYKRRRDLVVRTFQVSPYPFKAVRHIDDSRNVLKQAPAGPKDSNNSRKFRPEIAAVTPACLLSCHREGLAGKSSGEEVNAAEHGEGADVGGDGHAGPVLGEHAPAPGIALDELHGLDASGPLGGKRKSADAREGVKESPSLAIGHVAAVAIASIVAIAWVSALTSCFASSTSSMPMAIWSRWVSMTLRRIGR